MCRSLILLLSLLGSHFAFGASAASVASAASRAANQESIWESFFSSAETVVAQTLEEGLFTEEHIRDLEPFVLTNPVEAVIASLLMRSRTLIEALRLRDGSVVPFFYEPKDPLEKSFFVDLKKAKLLADELKLSEEEWADLYNSILISDVPDEQIQKSVKFAKAASKALSPKIPQLRPQIFDIRRTIEAMVPYRKRFVGSLEKAKDNFAEWEKRVKVPEGKAVEGERFVEEIDRPLFSDLEEKLMESFAVRIWDRLAKREARDQQRVEDWQRLALGLFETLQANVSIRTEQGSRTWQARDGFEMGLVIQGERIRVREANCPAILSRMYVPFQMAMEHYVTVTRNPEAGNDARSQETLEEEFFKYVHKTFEEPNFAMRSKKFAAAFVKNEEELFAGLSARKKLFVLIYKLSKSLYAFPQLRSTLETCREQIK